MKIKILAAGIALTLPFWACAKDVTIIYTNDLHAHVEPYKVPWIADGDFCGCEIIFPLVI